MMGQVQRSKGMRQTSHFPSIIRKEGSPSPLHPMCTRLWSQWITSSLFVHFTIAAFTADMIDTGKWERNAKHSRTANAFWMNLYAQAHTHTLWGIRCKALTNHLCRRMSYCSCGHDSDENKWWHVSCGCNISHLSERMLQLYAVWSGSSTRHKHTVSF